MAKTLITQSAWQIITREVKHFAYHPDGSKEAIIYPLFGLLFKNKKPIRKKIELNDIEYFVVTHAFTPPRELCNHHKTSAGFLFKNHQEEIKIVNLVETWSSQYTDIFPTLEVGHVHSHQFAIGKTRPSKDDYDRTHNLWKYLSQNRNLNTALEIIICQSPISSLCRKWNPCCFAFDKKQKIIDLGSAEIVPDNDKRVKEVLTIPFEEKKIGKIWELIQKKTIKNLDLRKNDWGWNMVRIQYAENKFAYIYLPPSFPDTKKVFYETYDENTEKLEKFQEWQITKPILFFNLSEIINFIKKGKIS